MKQLSFYTQKNLSSNEEVFNFLVEGFRSGVADWDYFVNWNKAYLNLRSIEITLNTLNYLLGKDNFDEEFSFLAKSNPEILQAIPILIVRNGTKSTSFDILTVEGNELKDEQFNFGNKDINDSDIKKALLFIKKSGLIRIFQKDGVKNLVDYVLGVEAGLDSNGRKNRGGTSMEKLCANLLDNLGYKYIKQAAPLDIERNFGIKINNCTGRKFDFVVCNNESLYIIEVNCYSGQGSKLDKTASDYRSLQDDLRGQATFIWITDGYGWKKTKIPLRKTFEHNDYIINLNMIREGILKEILNL